MCVLFKTYSPRQQSGVAHVVLASSAAVYGAGGAAAFDEDAPFNPSTPYGASKVAMEHIAAASYAIHESPAITIARIGNVAGVDALTAAAKRHIAAGKAMPLHRFEDGTTPLRSYIGPRDLFAAIHALSTPHGGPPRTVNLTHPQPVTLDSVLTGYRAHVLPNLEWVDAPVPTGTPHSVTLSTQKMRPYLEFQHYDDPADAMARQVAEYLAK